MDNAVEVYALELQSGGASPAFTLLVPMLRVRCSPHHPLSRTIGIAMQLTVSLPAHQRCCKVHEPQAAAALLPHTSINAWLCSVSMR